MKPGLPFISAEMCLRNAAVADLTIVKARSEGPRSGAMMKTRRTSPLAHDGKDG